MTIELGVLALVCLGLLSLAWRALDNQPDVPIDDDNRDEWDGAYDQ